MLLDHLDNHSRIYGFKDETRILPYFMQRKNGNLDEDDNLERLWNDMRCAFPFWKANGEECVPLPDNWREAARTPAQVFDCILSWFAAGARKEIWCEKTPMHALHITEIGAALPSSRFIHIIRDGRDCAASFRRRWGYNAKVAVHQWKHTICTARQQAESVGPNRYMEVRFEELTERPDEVFSEICRFLNVDFESRVLESSRTSARMRGIDSKQLKPNSGSYKSLFSASQIEELEELAGSMLDELGYPVMNSTGDSDLSSIYVGVQNALTRFGRMGDIYKRAKSSSKPWKLIMGRIRSGVGHIRSNRY